MQLASLDFLLFFFPAVVLIGFCVKPKHCPAVLAAAGVIYCALQGLSVLLPMLLAVSGTRVILSLMGESTRERRRKALCFTGVAWLLGMVLLSRFWHLSVPLQLALCVMQLAELLVIQQREATILAPFSVYFEYCFGLTRLWAGPVLTFSQYEIITQRCNRSFGLFSRSFGKFVRGLAKLVLLAMPAAAIAEQCMQNASSHTLTAFGAWIGLFAMFFSMRYGLGGMAQMGRGMGAMLGYSYPEELRGVWLADSYFDFWRCFWKSVAQWAERLFQKQSLPLRRGVRLFALGGTLGLLFGRGWNGIVWGLLLALLLWAESRLPAQWKQNTPLALRKMIVLFCVIAGIGTLHAHTFGGAADYTLALLGRNGVLPDADIYYALKTNWASLIGCILLLFPMRAWAEKRVQQYTVLRWTAAFLVPVMECLLLVLCLGTLLVA